MLALLVGAGARVWIEPLYIAPDVAPLGRLWAVIARDVDSPLAVLDSCIAFYPDWFNDCSALTDVREQLSDRDVLDFAGPPAAVPPAWQALRRQARDRFLELAIAEASFTPWAAPPQALLDESEGS